MLLTRNHLLSNKSFALHHCDLQCLQNIIIIVQLSLTLKVMLIVGALLAINTHYIFAAASVHPKW